MRISREDRKAIEAWIEKVQPVLKIADWHVELREEPPENPDSSAAMNSKVNQRVAAVWLSDIWFGSDYGDDQRTKTLTHELVHLHFEDVWHYIETLCDAELGNQAANLAKWVFRAKMEMPIDQISYALTDAVPLFRLPSGRSRRS